MAIEQRSIYGVAPAVGWVSVGSNAPDAPHRVGRAIARLRDEVEVTSATAVFVTPDIHSAFTRPPRLFAPRYANAVAVVSMPRPPRLTASPAWLADELKRLEAELGRSPAHKAIGLVNIDFDLVVAYGRILRPADWLRPYYHPRALSVVTRL